MKIEHPLRLGDVCTLTNRGISGVTKNDGKRCRTARLKPNQWDVTDRPPRIDIEN